MPTSDLVRRGEPTVPISTDRESLIEQLLLSGLDHYFAGRFEQAVHVWTRVFFLDRGHARARAYIERARSAIAEREREAEARAHLDAEACAHSCGTELLPGHARFRSPSRAIDVAYSQTTRRAVHVVLDEQEHGEAGPVAAVAPVARAHSPGGRPRPVAHVLLVGLAAVLLFGAGYVVAARDRIATWWRHPAQPHAVLPVAAADELKASRASERILASARELFAAGQLAATLRTLELIADDDPLRHAADRLLIDAQRALLARGGSDAAGGAGPSALSSSPAVR
jgi:hypothetical protein